MADIHVLDGSAPTDARAVTTRLAFHFPIPLADQVASVAQAMAGFESAVPNISAAELTAIRNGEVVEEVDSITWHPSEPEAELVARIKAQYTARKADVVTEYKARYRSFLATLAE